MYIVKRITALIMSVIIPFFSSVISEIKQVPETAQLSAELYRDGTPKKYFTLSFDDGITQDIRIMEICRKYGFYGCTFNINTGLCGAEWNWVGEQFGRPDVTHKRFTEEELKSGIYDGFDVAVHTLNHPSLKKYDNRLLKLKKEINKDADNIYEYTGLYPLGMAWPGGDTEYTDKTVDMVAKHTKMGFARAVGATNSFDLPQYFLKWHPTCSISDSCVLEMAEKFISAECSEDMLFYVWGHGYELDLFDNYETLEKLIKMMVEAEDVVTVTNAEFYLLFKDEIPRWK